MKLPQDNINEIDGFLAGGGETGKWIREFDWGKTTLGDPHKWPQTLKTFLKILLGNIQPDNIPQTTITIGKEVDESLLIRKKNEQNEERFRVLAESLPQLVWITNEKGEQEYVSKRWKEYTGIEPANLVTWKEIVHPDDLNAITEIWTNSISNGNVYSAETRLKNKKGEYRWHYVQGEPVKNENGRIAKWIGAFTDIHEQKSVAEKLEKKIADRTAELARLNVELQERNLDLENSQNFLQQVIDSSVEFISVVDKDLNYITVNKKFENSIGKSREELKGKHLFEFNPAVKNTVQHESILQTLKGSPIYLDKRPGIARADYYVDTYFVPLVIQNKIEGVIIMSRDVTYIVRSEKLLEQKNEELLRSNEDLQQFAHVASHDLKEPVRKITTFADKLHTELENILTDKAALYLSRLEHAAKRMNEMIEGILRYSSINAIEQEKASINLNDVLKIISDDLEIMIEQKNATLVYKDLPVLEGAPILIQQLFYNLVNNSLKFAKPEQPNTIYITSETIVQNNRVVGQITVRDTGIGFEEQDTAKIFDSFTRLNSKDKYEGTGLGLSLCKKIVERHNGTIRAEGEKNVGASFIITLPYVQYKTEI